MCHGGLCFDLDLKLMENEVKATRMWEGGPERWREQERGAESSCGLNSWEVGLRTRSMESRLTPDQGIYFCRLIRLISPVRQLRKLRHRGAVCQHSLRV